MSINKIYQVRAIMFDPLRKRFECVGFRAHLMSGSGNFGKKTRGAINAILTNISVLRRGSDWSAYVRYEILQI